MADGTAPPAPAPGPPRIKFNLTRAGTFQQPTWTPDLDALVRLMERMEELGATPILYDGRVAGNCAISPLLAGSTDSGPENQHILVSRSGKAPYQRMGLEDFVKVKEFSREQWGTTFESASEDVKPSSDTPLLYACLAQPHLHGWARCPLVAVHGHALAEGEGLEHARALGIPISARPTVVATQEDLAALEDLLGGYPYPQHRIYIRKGHGFVIVGDSVAEVVDTFDKMVAPCLEPPAAAAGGHKA